MSDYNAIKGKRYVDLSGQIFNKLTVLSRGEDYVPKKGAHIIRYNCECECGKHTLVRAYALKSGKTKSCGCHRQANRKPQGFDDLTGRKFHRWTVLYRTENKIEPSGRKVTMWQCVCDCGVEKAIRSGSLKSGSSKSCGCLKLDSLLVKHDLTNKRFGRWLVLEKRGAAPAAYGRNEYRWLCRCECGVEKEVSEQSLVQNKSASCGCFRNERLLEVASHEDLSGREYGHWSVLHRVEDRFYKGGGRSQMWRCRCVCGTVNDVAGQMLKPGISRSCGCVSESYLEKDTKQFLDNMGYKYSRQVKFDGLVGVGEGPLSYDFGVYDDNDNSKLIALIECQGEQHYRPIDYFGGLPRFKIQQEHDDMKKDFADTLGVALIEIPYMNKTYLSVSKLLSVKLTSII